MTPPTDADVQRALEIGVECCQQGHDPEDAAPCADCVAQALAAERARVIEEAAKVIPTNWVDSRLTGSFVLLKGSGPWGCPDIERLLLALAAAIRALSAPEKR